MNVVIYFSLLGLDAKYFIILYYVCELKKKY
jgi:hypothetical protein